MVSTRRSSVGLPESNDVQRSARKSARKPEKNGKEETKNSAETEKSVSPCVEKKRSKETMLPDAKRAKNENKESKKESLSGSTNIAFDKEKAIKKISEVVKNKPELTNSYEVSEKSSKAEIKELKAALANMEVIYKELKSLRTTEAEQLLKDERTTAAAKEESQSQLINELEAQLNRLKKEKGNAGSIEKLQKENAKLKEQNEKLEVELKSFGNNENKKILANSEDIQDMETKLKESNNLYKCYSRLTGVSITLENGAMMCTVKNKNTRRAVKFSIANVANKSIEFVPKGNKHFLPKEMQEASLFKSEEGPLLISRIVETLSL